MESDVAAGDRGGYSALYLASKYPDLVSRMFATGCERDCSSIIYSSWMAIKTYLNAVMSLILVSKSWILAMTEKLDMN
jgi:hypothetical protein